MMGEWVKLKASDGNELSAYVAKPEGEAVGALVVVQEIFGVNSSITGVADNYAKEGFLAIAPALFDRLEKNVILGYGEEDMKKAFSLYPKLDVDKALLDIAAAYKHVDGAGKGTAVLGFCYGGLMSWISATRGEGQDMQPACTVGYYAGGIGKVATEDPSCPVMLHFGTDDDHIGKDQVDAVREAHPEVEIFLYKGAGHAFANPARSSFVPDAAKVANARSLEFLKANIAS
jgi:carboxymethylenebutenolidase